MVDWIPGVQKQWLLGHVVIPRPSHHIDPILLTNTAKSTQLRLKIQVMNLSQALVTLQSHWIVGVCEVLEEETAGIYQVVVVGGHPHSPHEAPICLSGLRISPGHSTAAPQPLHDGR